VIASSSCGKSANREDSGKYQSPRHIKLQIETFRDPTAEDILTRDILDELNNGTDRPMKWGIQSSGTEIPPTVARRLEKAWERICVDHPFYPDELPEGRRFIEGATRVVLVNTYERDPEARRQCLLAHGTNCCVCGVNFGIMYGPFAEGYIHVHHLRPLSMAGGARTVDPIADLRPVCPNCHAALHRRVPMFSIEEMRDVLLRRTKRPKRQI
jgi:hypothetical protein